MSTPIEPVEEWRETAYPGYWVSSLGRVRGRRGHILSYHLNDGYRITKLSKYGNKKIHQLVCAAWHGERPAGAVTRHLDGNRENNRPENLRWGTVSDNNRDTYLHGRSNLTPGRPR